jgi:hypothetical protein
MVEVDVVGLIGEQGQGRWHTPRQEKRRLEPHDYQLVAAGI